MTGVKTEWWRLWWAGVCCGGLLLALGLAHAMGRLDVPDAEEEAAIVPVPLSITRARVRPLVPAGRRQAVVTMTIRNDQDEAVHLIRAAADATGQVVLCRCPLVLEGLSAMPKSLDSITVPARQSLKLQRGGVCLFLSDVNKQLQPGDELLLRLHFRPEGSLPVRARICKPSSSRGNLSGALSVPLVGWMG